MATESDLNAYLDHAAKVAASVYHASTRDGSIPAIGREAVADIRNSMHEMFFGKSERGGQPGTPLNPLFHDIVEARKSHGDVHGAGPQVSEPANAPLPSAGEIAHQPEDVRGSVYGPQQQQTAVQADVQGHQVGTAAQGNVYGPEKGVHGGTATTGLATAGQIAEQPEDLRGGVYGTQHGHETQVAQLAPAPAPAPAPDPIPGGFAEDYLIQRGKVLPDDQLENNKGRDR
jgi:hypothetical protein